MRYLIRVEARLEARDDPEARQIVTNKEGFAERLVQLVEVGKELGFEMTVKLQKLHDTEPPKAVPFNSDHL